MKTVAQVSRELEIKKSTLVYWYLTGKIPQPKKVGGARVWTPAQVNTVAAYAAERKSGDVTLD